MQILIQNLGPLWKIVCLWNMGVDVPQSAVTAVLKEGPRMLPWGTPDNTGSGSDIELQILTHWKRL